MIRQIINHFKIKKAKKRRQALIDVILYGYELPPKEFKELKELTELIQKEGKL